MSDKLDRCPVYGTPCEYVVKVNEDSEMLTIAWMDGSHRSTKAHRETIRNLRETGDRLAGYSGHDRECAINSATPSVCNCGYTTTINAWKELGS